MTQIGTGCQHAALLDNTRQLAARAATPSALAAVAAAAAVGRSFRAGNRWQRWQRLATHSALAAPGNAFRAWQAWRRLATDSEKWVSPASAASDGKSRKAWKRLCRTGLGTLTISKKNSVWPKSYWPKSYIDDFQKEFCMAQILSQILSNPLKSSSVPWRDWGPLGSLALSW